jgi:hypothetical protein
VHPPCTESITPTFGQVVGGLTTALAALGVAALVMTLATLTVLRPAPAALGRLPLDPPESAVINNRVARG